VAQFNALSFHAGHTTGAYNLSISATTTGADAGAPAKEKYSLDVSDPVLTTLFSFNGSDGDYPYASLIANPANGDLFGMTAGGGPNGGGTVFEIGHFLGYSGAPNTLVSFNGLDGAAAVGGVIADASGDLFGTTSGGGADDDGTVFEIKNDGTVAAPNYASAPVTLATFNGSDGDSPSAALVADAYGNLFGTTYYGGAENDGTLFEIKNNGAAAAPSYASTPITISFDGLGGANPDASLLVGPAHDGFGTTQYGGAYDGGTVFEVTSNGAVVVLVSFNGLDGADPQAGLIADARGDLFGTTSTGGQNGYGTVFEIKNNGAAAAPSYAGAPTTLVSFNGNDGADPEAGLIADGKGDLFGTTYMGGPNNDGTVFEIKNNGTGAAPRYASKPTVIASFNGANGESPQASLVADASGNLLGTTNEGGANGDGTVFEIAYSGFVPPPAPSPVLVSFNFSDGAAPSGVIVDAKGDLLGTTESGGGYGNVFEIKNNGAVAAPSYATTPNVIASFDISNGEYPSGALIADAKGDLFGATGGGGANGDGTVFEIENNGAVAAPSYATTPTVVASFNGSDGLGPTAGLIVDAKGDLFGTTIYGGANSDGTVFEIENNGAVEAPSYATMPTVTASFNGSDGSNPTAGLIADPNGDLFGTTYLGDAVFEIKNNGTVAAPNYATTPNVIASFDISNGEYPYGALIADANGDLFGTTERGGANDDGTVFEIVNNGTLAAPSYASTPATLVGFNGSNGANPYNGLIVDANGDLFGTTYYGGANNVGTAFEIKNNGTVVAPNYASTPTTLVSFNGSNGANPYAGVSADANGDLFGTTDYGGAQRRWGSVRDHEQRLCIS
jgi:uncharacterized repeat protein (TIGR03803 family)